MAFTAYIISVTSLMIFLFFFKIWESGKYFNVAIASILIRLLLIPIFEIYGSKIMPAEIPELLQWYEEWQNFLETNSFINILLNPFSIDGPRGMFLYYTVYAGWFLQWGSSIDMIPLRILTSTLSLFIIVFSKYLIKWLYEVVPTPKQVLIITNWPFWLLYSVSLGRTMPSVLIPLFGIVAFYKILTKYSLSGLLFVIFTFWVTMLLRTFYSFFYLTTFISFFTYQVFLGSERGNRIWHRIFVGVFGVFLIVFLANSFNIQDVFILIVDNLTQSDQVEGSASGSSYLTSFYPQVYTDLFYYMPIQGIYFLLSPMIWDVYKADQLLSCLFSTLLLILLLKTLLNQENYYNHCLKAKMIMLNMILVCMILGVGVKNAGAAQRWRLPITSVLLCITLPNLKKK